MYKVKFNDVTFFEHSEISDVLRLSLDLHKISNVEHNIIVTKDDNIIVTLKNEK